MKLGYSRYAVIWKLFTDSRKESLVKLLSRSSVEVSILTDFLLLFEYQVNRQNLLRRQTLDRVFPRCTACQVSVWSCFQSCCLVHCRCCLCNDAALIYAIFMLCIHVFCCCCFGVHFVLIHNCLGSSLLVMLPNVLLELIY